MANVINTLYPPMMPYTFMPAFVNTDNATVYYTLSPYNSKGSIEKIHISVVDQATNSNALKSSNGITVSNELLWDEAAQMYYVSIPYTSMLNETFKTNQFYKVQLRFDTTVGDVPTENSLGQYLIDNQPRFSEWSTVCLIKPILKPTILLTGIVSDATPSASTSFNKGIIPVSGKVYFGNNDTTETETLQSYSLSVLDYKDEVVLETPTVYTGGNVNPNEINYKLDAQNLDTDESRFFSLVVHITTNNQYQCSRTYPFQIVEYMEDESFSPKVSAIVDNEDGIVNISIKNTMNVIGTLYIKRACSVDNFTTWENFYITDVNGDIDLELQDNTVGSMMWYRYSAQFENNQGSMTKVFKSEKVFPNFHDATLSRMETQVSLRYNFKVSSMRPVVNRTKVDTLGGKYPKFTENGTINYKQFSVSGLISAQEDYNNKFMTKREHFNDSYNDYRIYSEQNGITEYDDYLWEREFREELTAWLNDGEPKLFRSMTEGIMCVMLSDVSLTPNTVLSRRLWDFTATVYEIAEGTSLATLESLGIFDSGENALQEKQDNTPTEYVLVSKIGQIYNTSFTDNYDIVNNSIFENLEKEYTGILDGHTVGDIALKDVKIYFLNDPNVFSNTDGNLTLVSKENINSLTEDAKSRLQRGYIFSVNSGQGTIFVNENGYYQIPSAIDVKYLYFPTVGDKVTIDYTITYKEYQSPGSEITGSSITRTVVGQYHGVFKPNKYLGDDIKKRYSFADADAGYYERMLRWKGISVEVNPYSVVSVQYASLGEFKDYVVGESGTLNLLEDMVCTDLCFKGRRMFKRPIDRQPYLSQNEFVLDEGTYQNLEAIMPKHNTVYTIGTNSKIWYDNKWYDFTLEEDGESGIAAVNVSGSINYYGDVLRSDYQ